MRGRSTARASLKRANQGGRPPPLRKKHVARGGRPLPSGTNHVAQDGRPSSVAQMMEIFDGQPGSQRMIFTHGGGRPPWRVGDEHRGAVDRPGGRDRLAGQRVDDMRGCRLVLIAGGAREAHVIEHGLATLRPGQNVIVGQPDTAVRFFGEAITTTSPVRLVDADTERVGDVRGHG